MQSPIGRDRACSCALLRGDGGARSRRARIVGVHTAHAAGVLREGRGLVANHPNEFDRLPTNVLPDPDLVALVDQTRRPEASTALPAETAPTAVYRALDLERVAGERRLAGSTLRSWVRARWSAWSLRRPSLRWPRLRWPRLRSLAAAGALVALVAMVVWAATFTGRRAPSSPAPTVRATPAAVIAPAAAPTPTLEPAPAAAAAVAATTTPPTHSRAKRGLARSRR
jgi:hypothetical protein